MKIFILAIQKGCLRISADARSFIFCSCVVGDDALHRPAMLTSATSSQGVLHEFPVPLTLGPSFSVRPENEAKEGSQDLRS